MTRPRYLTKSRFSLGMDCPTKLYYTGKADYPDKSLDDSFLAALAQGGYQVGELAKYYYPGGHQIDALDYDEALEQTNELLKLDKVIIYEAAIRHNNLFIRTDILVKSGDHFDLIEVKAKSYEPGDTSFFSKRGGILKSWEPYLNDVAFQRHVLANALQTTNIDAYLMMANKLSTAATDGLNAKFKIVQAGKSRKSVEVSSTLNDADLANPLLVAVPVNDEIAYIYQEGEYGGTSFEHHISHLASLYEKGMRADAPIGSVCKKCQFKCSPAEESAGLKSGFKECWKKALGWEDSDFDDPTILEIANFRRSDELIAAGKVKIDDLDPEDFTPKENNGVGLNQSHRQWLQVQKVLDKDSSIYLDAKGLSDEMAKWEFPLHFIDFETSQVAIPFTRGRRPYEGIAFQFSHHIVRSDGSVEHAGEFLDTTPGHFPNFDFIKQLKAQLEGDKGTIFRYATHENTYLNLIHTQLKNSDLPTDEIIELCEFIKSITSSVADSPVTWRGDRDMVDMHDLVKRFYYAPSTRGSTSIKAILPAILNSSDYIKNKYSQPIYGATGGITSKNFSDWEWVQFDGDKVQDPYKLLPQLFDEDVENVDEFLSQDNVLADGGAALSAYSKLQFVEMTEEERDMLNRGLLKYCELDTLAMVMIYEAWRYELTTKEVK